MVGRVSAVILVLSSLVFGDVVEDVRVALTHNDFSRAESQLQAYQAQHGFDPAYLEGLSWMARAALEARDYKQAYAYARKTHLKSGTLLKKRKLDAEPHLPIALGAAYEVEAQVLVAQGERPKAVILLKSAIQTYGNTSIGARLQKNLNSLTLLGKPAPPLKLAEHLGPAPVALAELKGSPVLLFFWAHWCADCKGESPIITQLRSEFAPKGLVVIAPTPRYGYGARGEKASPRTELAYIQNVWQHYYAGLQSVPVPVSQENFNTYGASTTPTLVLIDRAGRIAMYHPGAMPYEELRSAIDKVVAN